MTCNSNNKAVLNNGKFILFSLSQGVSNLGDAFQLIAAVSLLRRVTGSGLPAAFGLVCTPMLSILFSTLAGYLSDIRNEKFLLILIDLLRGLVVLLFISRGDVLQIYILITVLSVLDILYNPPRRKFITGIQDKAGLIAANSILNGISGGMYIIGPILAGFVILNFGADIAFMVNSISFFLSAFFIGLIKLEKDSYSIFCDKEVSIRNTVDSLYTGMAYCINNYTIRKIILIGTILCFCTTSVNIAFYPFAFDFLQITDRTWGFMMSIFYGASLLAMPLTLLINIKERHFYKIFLPCALLIISTIWFSYANTDKIRIIMLLQLLEGILFTFINIVLTSHLQAKSSKELLGRVIGINDFVNNFGKIMGIGCTYILLTFTLPDYVFLFCAAVISFYAVFIMMTIKSKRLKLQG